jgi:hypothetical protein
MIRAEILRERPGNGLGKLGGACKPDFTCGATGERATTPLGAGGINTGGGVTRAGVAGNFGCGEPVFGAEVNPAGGGWTGHGVGCLMGRENGTTGPLDVAGAGTTADCHWAMSGISRELPAVISLIADHSTAPAIGRTSTIIAVVPDPNSVGATRIWSLSTSI